MPESAPPPPLTREQLLDSVSAVVRELTILTLTTLSGTPHPDDVVRAAVLWEDAPQVRAALAQAAGALTDASVGDIRFADARLTVITHVPVTVSALVAAQLACDWDDELRARGTIRTDLLADPVSGAWSLPAAFASRPAIAQEFQAQARARLDILPFGSGPVAAPARVTTLARLLEDGLQADAAAPDPGRSYRMLPLLTYVLQRTPDLARVATALEEDPIRGLRVTPATARTSRALP